MFIIDDDKTIHLNRGDIAPIKVGANNGNEPYTFTGTDVVRIQIVEKGKYDQIVLQKEITAEEGSQSVTIFLTKEDTKIGDVINKQVEYWYEIELNPDNNPQTIIGHDKDGPKKFMLYPEGA